MKLKNGRVGKERERKEGREKGSEREENRKGREREKAIKLKNGRVGKEIKSAETLYTHDSHWCFSSNFQMRSNIYRLLCPSIMNNFSLSANRSLLETLFPNSKRYDTQPLTPRPTL